MNLYPGAGKMTQRAKSCASVIGGRGTEALCDNKDCLKKHEKLCNNRLRFLSVESTTATPVNLAADADIARILTIGTTGGAGSILSDVFRGTTLGDFCSI